MVTLGDFLTLIILVVSVSMNYSKTQQQIKKNEQNYIGLKAWIQHELSVFKEEIVSDFEEREKRMQNEVDQIKEYLDMKDEV